jgi:hypothetical protein
MMHACSPYGGCCWWLAHALYVDYLPKAFLAFKVEFYLTMTLETDRSSITLLLLI